MSDDDKEPERMTTKDDAWAGNAFGVRSTAELMQIPPSTEKWYQYETRSYIADAIEKAWEWDYAKDPHGYCHDRSTLVRLLAEIERLQALVDRPEWRA